MLHNQIDSRILKEKIRQNQEPRTTISFYRYVRIVNPVLFRDYLYIHFDALGVLGRIYVAQEGINAQISLPAANLNDFKQFLNEVDHFKDIRLNYAVDDDGKSFFKLMIKVRPKIVADGLHEDIFEVSGPAPYLSAEQFNALVDKEDVILVDMRNHYESEVGHFKNAWCPDVDTFRDQLPAVVNFLENQKDKKVVMYCTGGIRCEKASAYMKYKGFKDVYHIEGGIINYARVAKDKGLENKYIGKNFVFDERLSECISDDVIAHCHQCGEAWDLHRNCRNKACNQLFIQCPACVEKYQSCCSDECMEIAALPEEVQKQLRKGKDSGRRIFSKGRFVNA
jgi:UPF0176 protein